MHSDSLPSFDKLDDIPEYPALESAGIYNPVMLVRKFIALGMIKFPEKPKTIPRCPCRKKAEWKRLHPNWDKPAPNTSAEVANIAAQGI
jgi:hypothetical protein